jgi:hypothetical protein
MTKPSTVPVAPKTLALDDLLDDFEPRPAIKAAALSASTPAASANPAPRARQTETAFPSREPKGPKHVQVNCYLKAGVADRFKAFLRRDDYTIWSYGDAIEFLLDQYERGGKKSKS